MREIGLAGEEPYRKETLNLLNLLAGKLEYSEKFWTSADSDCGNGLPCMKYLIKDKYGIQMGSTRWDKIGTSKKKLLNKEILDMKFEIHEFYS
jgi:hypothetical protein